MKERLLNLLTHPALISLLIWLIIILFIPQVFSKYRVKYIGDISAKNLTNLYEDLDSDNESERIMVETVDPGQTKILIYKQQNKVHEQFNIKYTLTGGKAVYFGDYNSDGFEECFVFTMSTDSIFLTIFDPMSAKDFIIRNRFIDFRRIARQSNNIPLVRPVTFMRDDQTDRIDLVFYITTGFARQPRRVYRYMISQDSLIRSPESGACITEARVFDVNLDGSPEIILSIQATGNFNFEIPYTDQYGWLMVLNKNMEFLFKPVCIPKYPSHFNVIPIKTDQGINLVGFNNYFGTDTLKAAFYLFNSEGIQIKKSNADKYTYSLSRIFPNEYNDYSTFFFLKDSAIVEEINSNLIKIKEIRFPKIELFADYIDIDADHDGRNEHIFYGNRFTEAMIVRGDFSDYTLFPLKNGSAITTVSQVLKKGEKPLLYLQAGDYGVYYQYSRNNAYFLRYLFYAAIYLLIYLFILLTFRLQAYRLKNKEEMGKQMALLQMKAIKNQIDPHFTLNILNSIGSLYASENNREQADYIFGKYARLIRETVISSDQIIIPLADELEFITNYIDLERFRCSNSFSYEINTDPAIDLQKKIPRMLIHTFVENSIKHGLKNAGGDGILKISVKSDPGRYLITIEDNNSDTGKKDEKSTGKGLSIIKELIELYFRLEKVKISFSLEPINSKENLVTGRIARIVIPV